MAAEGLESRTRDELLGLAKKRGLRGVSNLRKAELLAALEAAHTDGPHAEGGGYRPPLVGTAEAGRDAVTLTAAGPRWCRIEWSLTPAAVRRAEKAMGRDWRSAAAAVVVHEASRPAEPLGEAEVPADAREWYVRLGRPAGGDLRASLLVRAGGRTHSVATSPPAKAAAGGRASAEAPLPGEILEEIHRLHNAADAFAFEVRGEMRLRGRTRPGTRVSAGDLETVADADGAFAFGVPMDVGRTVLPIEAVSPDGGERRSGVAAAEFSLKVFDPDGGEE